MARHSLPTTARCSSYKQRTDSLHMSYPRKYSRYFRLHASEYGCGPFGGATP
jgi:hypothetical protein